MPITSNTSTVTVSDSGSLKDAYNTLSRNGGGTIEVAQGADPIEIALRGGGKDHVDIVSADDDAPTLLHRISFEKVENVTVSDFRIDSTGVSRPDWHKDVMVSGGADIVIENSTFASNAVGRYTPGQGGTVLGETLGLIRNTKDFSFEGNTAKDYYHGLAILETTGASVTDNEFSGFQGDGLRLAGVQQTEISGNYIHDFVGTTRNFDHNDFIQIWSTNAKLLTKDLTISGNTLDAGDGSSAQGIFIGNERYSAGDKGHRYQNIEISDNVVHSGNTNGIAVFGGKDVDIANNTVLWNTSSSVIEAPGDSGISRRPLIRVEGVTESTITDNIATGFISRDASVVTGNKTVNYTQPDSPDYVGSNFVDALGGGGGLSLTLRSDSSWDGVAGATQSWSTSAATPAEVPEPEIDETPEPVETPDTEKAPEPETPDTEANLPLVPDSASPAKDSGATVVDVDFESGATGSSLGRFDSGALVQGGGDTSYRIGAGNTLQVARGTDGLHDLEAFSLEMDVEADTGDLSGALLHFYNVFEVTTDRDGALRFTLETDEGKFFVTADGNPLADGREHRLGVAYDDDLGQMSLSVDDRIVAEGEAHGVTADQSYYGLTIGNTWSVGRHDTFDMQVDDIVFQSRISDGEAPQATPETPPASDAQMTLEDDFNTSETSIGNSTSGEFDTLLS